VAHSHVVVIARSLAYPSSSSLPGLVSYQFVARIRDPHALGADQLRAMKERWCELLRETDFPKVFGK
jgi:hypothetical protein